MCDQFVQVGARINPAHPKANNTWLGKDLFLPQKGTHYGTPFLSPSAYKVRVGGVSPRRGIEQIRMGGCKGWPYLSQSEQYLIGERFIPPTKRRFEGNAHQRYCLLWVKTAQVFYPEGHTSTIGMRQQFLRLAMITHTMVHPSLGQVLIR